MEGALVLYKYASELVPLPILNKVGSARIYICMGDKGSRPPQL